MSSLVHLAILACFGLSPANEPTATYKETAIRILGAGLEEVKAYELLEALVAIGPRVAGSDQAEAALRLMRESMVEIGLEQVHGEPVTVRRWTRGVGEKAAILGPGGDRVELSVLAAGFTVPTPEGGLTAPVVEVRSSDELKELGDKLRDSLVFINCPMDKHRLDMFNNAAWTLKRGRRGAVAEAARAGARAVLMRSFKIAADDHPQTLVVRYGDEVPRIPVGYLSTNAADRLSEHLGQHGESTVYLSFPCMELEPAESYNVVGQITGSEFPDEVILLGAHIDTWDVSVGAHDDGAGCVQVVEALRLLRSLGLKPRRTIRGVLFAEEEHGNAGGIAYAASKRRQGEKHVVAIEADRGGFRPLGFNVNAEKVVLEWLKQWEDVLEEVGIYWFGTGWGGTTTEPLHEQGTPKIALVPDSQRYWELYHSAKDTLDKVDERELELGAVALATLAYLLAQEGVGGASAEAEWTPKLTIRAPTVEEAFQFTMLFVDNAGAILKMGRKVRFPGHPAFQEFLETPYFVDDPRRKGLWMIYKSEIYEESDFDKGLKIMETHREALQETLRRLSVLHDNWGYQLFPEYVVTLSTGGLGIGHPLTGIATVPMGEEGDFNGVAPPAYCAIHELVHTGLEFPIVQRFQLTHWEKERVVDLICKLYLEDLFGREYTGYDVPSNRFIHSRAGSPRRGV